MELIKEIKNWVLLLLYIYLYLMVFLVTLVILSLAIFGGSFEIKINWHSAIDLYNILIK